MRASVRSLLLPPLQLAGSSMAALAEAYRTRLRWLIAFSVLILLSAALAHGQSDQASLTGVVMDKGGKPKPSVAIDILGPTKVYTETDGSGRFTVRLRPGSYVIRVREGDLRMEFPRRIGEGSNESYFRLAW
jgi:hypothetical protein